jgi:hypothetical protein
MASRRGFLKEVGALATLSTLGTSPLVLPARAEAPGAQASPTKDREPLGFKPHAIKQVDGRGGWLEREGEYQFMHLRPGRYLFPYGIIQMDNGEVILIAAWHDGQSQGIAAWKPAVAFSRDGGRTWTEAQAIEGSAGRPVMPTYLGKGNLMFQTDLVTPVMQYYSRDYGRTWPERRELQLASTGEPYNDEGNMLVDRDAHGVSTKIASVGYKYPKGTQWPVDPAIGMMRWSDDAGRTWSREVAPEGWRWSEEYGGKTYTRGISEGSLVRAANSWLVAALRTDIPARYLDVPHDDSLEGLAVSISKDDGAAWSPAKILYDAGRHHPHLLRLANNDLLMTIIVRADVRDGHLASYRRGLEALVSRDHGLTWDLAHKYILDDYEFHDGLQWYNGECGHLYSTLLDDGFVLSCYGKYLTGGSSIIRWKPAAR